MNKKITPLCFILLLFLLIGVASAAENDNETLQHHVKQPDNEIQQTVIESSQENCEKIETTNINPANSQSSNGEVSEKFEVHITAPNVKMYYNDGTKFTVSLKDHNNQAMKRKFIKISVNGKTYKKKTDNKGKAFLCINLKSGKYKVKTTFEETKVYGKKTVESMLTVKSTIKCNEFSKYYTENKAYQATFLDKKGKCLKSSSVKFKINGKTHYVNTDKTGKAKISIILKPGKYSITITNSKTSETVTKTATVKSLLETKDMIMSEHDGSEFTVKVLDNNGGPSANKEVTLKVKNNRYTIMTDSNGIARQTIDLEAGNYSISTKYSGLENINKITVNRAPVQDAPEIINETAIEGGSIENTKFMHSTIIPNYINVTIPYAFHNSDYTLKTGTNGTVKMPKVEVFTVDLGSKTYKFATGKTGIDDTMILEYKSYLIPLSGWGIVVSVNKNNLWEPGIIITRTPTYTQIDYQDTTSSATELFGFYADKSGQNSETFTYLKNDKVRVKVSVQTQYYDETGVKYSLAKLYQRVNADFNYYEITNHVSDPIVFTNTGKPVTYSYFTEYIVGYPTREDIITKFSINGREEMEKTEQISYGHAEKYRKAMGFEILQSYTIIAEKVTKGLVENWTNANSDYLSRFGVMNAYGMHMASLETAWLADEIADEFAKEFNVNWNRKKAVAILGGINLEDTYLHVLNADMGMGVSGNRQNVELFRLINSINLPNIEDYVLEPVAARYLGNTTNSLDNVLSSMSQNNFSIAQFGEMIYVFGENDSAIILNTTSGLSNVILAHGNAVYKGSRIHTSEDCCGVALMPNDIINGLRDMLKISSPGLYLLSDHFKNIHPLSLIAYKGLTFILGKTLTGVSSSLLGLATTIVVLQDGAVKYRDGAINEKDWHSAMDTFTITRPGYMQSKKVYNIPNKSGGTDYIEVKINDDLTLDRSSAVYISAGETKRLTKEETYQYFCEDYWTPFSMPTKYWDKSWRG